MPPAATIGDRITAKRDADMQESQAKAAAAAASESLAAATTQSARANADLKADLAKTGAAYTTNADGSIDVYIPDGSDAGYHVIHPAPASTSLAGATAAAPGSAPGASAVVENVNGTTEHATEQEPPPAESPSVPEPTTSPL